MDQFTSIRDVLMSKHVTQKDKTRMIQCARKVHFLGEQKHLNSSVCDDTNMYIYKVHEDHHLTLIATLPTKNYHHIQIK